MNEKQENGEHTHPHPKTNKETSDSQDRVEISQGQTSASQDRVELSQAEVVVEFGRLSKLIDRLWLIVRAKLIVLFVILLIVLAMEWQVTRRNKTIDNLKTDVRVLEKSVEETRVAADRTREIAEEVTTENPESAAFRDRILNGLDQIDQLVRQHNPDVAGP
jgi:hypothetical protein